MPVSFFILLWLCLLNMNQCLAKSVKLLVYYSTEATAENFMPYQLLILDSGNHHNLTSLQDKGKTLLGYLSIGEINKNHQYYDKMKNSGSLLFANQNWQDSWFVDLRDPAWTGLIIETLIPDIMRNGFHGLFLDTVDDAEYLETQDPKRSLGMRNAAIAIIKTIRHNFPDIKLMLNRGFYLLPQLSTKIDMVLAESVYSNYNFQTKQYQFVKREQYEEQQKLLLNIKRSTPALQIYSLDYWNPADKKRIAEI